MVARQTLTLFVWVRILVRLPLKPLILESVVFYSRSNMVSGKKGIVHTCVQSLSCDVKPLARRVVQKKAIAEDEEIKTPFAIIKKRSANCI